MQYKFVKFNLMHVSRGTARISWQCVRHAKSERLRVGVVDFIEVKHISLAGKHNRRTMNFEIQIDEKL